MLTILISIISSIVLLYAEFILIIQKTVEKSAYSCIAPFSCSNYTKNTGKSQYTGIVIESAVSETQMGEKVNQNASKAHTGFYPAERTNNGHYNNHNRRLITASAVCVGDCTVHLKYC